jgi:hypothetical protein
VASGRGAAGTIRTLKTGLPLVAHTYWSRLILFGGVASLRLAVLGASLVLVPAMLAQTPSAVRGLPDAPDAVPVAAISTENSNLSSGDQDGQQPPSQQPATAAPAATTSTPQQTGSSVSPELKGQTELGDAQLKKQETQRILGVMPAFNSVYEGTVPPLTPKQKFQLMWKSTTDAYVFAFAAFTAGIGQAQNSHAAYGQGVEGYAKRFGANYADTADGNLWGNAILTVALHEDPRYFRLGHGTFTHRLLYSMSTSVWCKRDSGTAGPNYANVFGNLIAGGISNLYYPAADRGVGQTFQNAGTVTAEGMIGAALIEFWPDIAHHYKVKKQAKVDAAAAATRNAQAVALPPTDVPR